MRPTLALLAVLLVAFPGVAAQAPSQPEVVDAPDDARESDVGTAATVARASACRSLAQLRPTCALAPTVDGADARPAAPTMEALAAWFDDTPDELVVTLQLAGVDPAFPGAVAADRTRGAIYSVCWSTSDEPCSEAVVLAAIPAPDGTPQVTALFENVRSDCNDAGRCAWRVPHELIAGAPGLLRWRVPRAVLPTPDAGALLDAPTLSVVRYLSPSGRPAWPSEDGVGYGVVGPDANASTYGYTANHYLLVDASEAGTPYRLASGFAAADLDASFVRLADPQGDVVGDARPDIDVLGVRFVETDTALTVAVEAALVEAEPADHLLYGAFALPTGRFYTWGYAATGGTRAPYANVCLVPLCHQMAAPALREIPVNVTVSAGAPGWINATFPRASLEEPARGWLVDSVDVTMYTYNASTTREQSVPSVGRLVVVASGGTDTLAPAPAWWFRDDTRREVESEGLFVEDPQDDGATSPILGDREGQFDLTYVEAVGATPEEVRVTLGFRDLSTVSVPTGASAIFYGAGFELADGRRIVAGFHRGADLAQPGEQTFLCGEDVTVLADAPADPLQGVYTAITGVISSRSGPNFAGGSQGGAITIFVPYACFGRSEPGPIEVARFEAASFYVLPGQAPTRVDAAAHEGGGVILARIVAPRAPWYAEPFGIQNFWDVFGILASLVASAVGVLVVRRKRHATNKYLAEVERIAVAHADDARAREKALLALRHTLKEELVNSRLDQAHFLLVDRRIDELLARTRVLGLAEAFEDLPHGLLRRLQELLADGQMSAADYRVFSALLEETGLTPEAKGRVRRKLQIWVREDVTEAPQPPKPADA